MHQKDSLYLERCFYPTESYSTLIFRELNGFKSTTQSTLFVHATGVKNIQLKASLQLKFIICLHKSKVIYNVSENNILTITHTVRFI